MGHAPGLVGVIAQDTARFSAFPAALSSLEVPAGTQINWVIGHQIAESTNQLVRTMLANDALEWLWIMGDDHVFAPDILSRLLSHHADIVVPLCLTRMPPYKPVAFTEWEAWPIRQRLRLDDHQNGGLVEIHSAGSAGMLIRRPVFEKMRDPWFEDGIVAATGEDLWFCDKARDLGFNLWCDLDARLGHITSATVWPVREPDGWTYGFGFVGGLKITMPADAWDAAEVVA